MEWIQRIFLIDIDAINALINTADGGIVIRFKIIYQKTAQTSKNVCCFFIYSSNLHIKPFKISKDSIVCFLPKVRLD